MKPDPSFSADQMVQIEAHGLTEAQALQQMDRFRRGAVPIRLNRPCTLGDGIMAVPAQDRDSLLTCHELAAAGGRLMKFVPASGAASRMFREWFRCLDVGRFETGDAAGSFDAGIGRFAFYDDLDLLVSRRGHRLADWIAQGRRQDILRLILTPEGLNYSRFPKALLKFHKYPQGSRTALEEHLVEAALYVKDDRGIGRIHFTVSEEHRPLVERYLSDIRSFYEKRYEVRFDIGISVQSAATDTLAVDAKNRPFRDDSGRLVLRPGGHGALLPNLNDLPDGDIVFLKNIDNVVPDHLKGPMILHKKIIAGYLLTLQNRIFHHLRRLANHAPDQRELDQVVSFCQQQLCLAFPSGYADLPLAEKRRMVFSKLNRPIRVCGVVRNESEPGGGPFWVEGEEGTHSLQIVEESQVDQCSEAQRAIWSSATHFNPVDLVCGVKDYRGNKHDLQRFIDQQAYCIVRKSEKGRDLKALELPGLWNGSMARWITVFVEVPLETFNPVKSVYDLLRPAHQAAL